MIKFELSQNLWERFGFLDNPFDTRALSLAATNPLSVAEAFVGRGIESAESRIMTNFLRNPGGGRIIVEGDVGVGKTTFVNYHRYLWENEAKTKLFTPASEISVQDGWGVREFLLSILGALAGRLALQMTRQSVEKDKLLAEVFALTGVLIKELSNISGGVSVLGTGGSFSRGKSLTVQLGEMRPEMLMDYLRKILKRVLNDGFVGVIFHLNNLELLARRDSQKLGLFFDEVRDYLQEPNLYFIFVGHKGMFQEVIVPLERVRSIFYGQPIHLPPLNLEDVKDAIERRYDLLAIRAGRWIRPVDQSMIDYLYDIFSGRIRFIMDSITTLVSNLPEGVTGTVSAKAAREFLKELTWQRVKSVLTEAELFVLDAAVKQQRFTNSSLVKNTQKSKQNIAKYLNRLLGLNFIYLAERRGRNVYYEIAPDLIFLDI